MNIIIKIIANRESFISDNADNGQMLFSESSEASVEKTAV